MNEPGHVPRWIVVGFLAPLALIAVVNGIGMYYGLRYLSTTVDNIQGAIAEMPTESDVESQYKFATYRIGRLEDRVSINASHIRDNRDAINKIRPNVSNTLWMQDDRPVIANLIWPRAFGGEPRPDPRPDPMPRAAVLPKAMTVHWGGA